MKTITFNVVSEKSNKTLYSWSAYDTKKENEIAEELTKDFFDLTKVKVRLEKTS